MACEPYDKSQPNLDNILGTHCSARKYLSGDVEKVMIWQEDEVVALLQIAEDGELSLAGLLRTWSSASRNPVDRASLR